MPDHHVDPLVGYGFLVSLGATEPEAVAAGFQEVEGLGASIGVVEYRNGNDKESSVRKLPGLRKFDNVTLKRGLILDLSLWEWFDSDPPDPRDVTITLLDEALRSVMRFHLRDAWPCRWTGPHLHGAKSLLAVESVELTIRSLQLEVI